MATPTEHTIATEDMNYASLVLGITDHGSVRVVKNRLGPNTPAGIWTQRPGEDLDNYFVWRNDQGHASVIIFRDELRPTGVELANFHLATAVLRRIASVQAVTIAGVLDTNSTEGRELIGRIELARDALDIMGIKHSATPGTTPFEDAEIDRQVQEFAKGIDPRIKEMLAWGHQATEDGSEG